MFPFHTSPALLSAEDTRKFVKQTDLAFRLLDLEFLTEVLEKFQLHRRPEHQEFLEEADKILEFWERKPVRIESVSSFDSRCIACSYGKEVKAYEVNYSQALLQEKEAPRSNYSLKFALNYEIKEGCLWDFAWCNGFLDEKEMTEISTARTTRR